MNALKNSLFLLLFAVVMAFSGCAPPDTQSISKNISTVIAENDPLSIRSIIVGSTQGEIVSEDTDGETIYKICLAMSTDTEFKRITANLELAEGAVLSDESNCILGDLMGRPVLNLTVEDAQLTVENDGEKRTYRFEIDLL
ncbi:hypothetical protein V6615_01775 [Oscillospiraceae bacterium PP1C4]